VIDKDHASGLLARDLNADAFLMLTDVIPRRFEGASRSMQRANL
jgi:carbamate kinase